MSKVDNRIYQFLLLLQGLDGMCLSVESLSIWISSFENENPCLHVWLQFSVLFKKSNCSVTSMFCESAMPKNFVTLDIFTDK